jgi:NAD(P)-dependent dehydrogenase (short-subunit alcohol dehydrogenase family)
MRILVVGGSGLVGRAAIVGLAKGHDIIVAGRTSGAVQVDVTEEASISAMYRKVGQLDAMVACVGDSHFGPLAQMTPAQFLGGLRAKVMSQIDLVLLGLAHVKDGGSFTLTSGILSHEPVREGANASACDGAINSFVMGAAVEMPRGIRINAVSPGVLVSAMQRYEGTFPGHQPVSDARVGFAYAKAIEGVVTGQVIRCE